jgi:S-adenosylmethionine decarboxylase proenzyme
MIKTHITLDFYQAKAEILAKKEDLKNSIVEALSKLDLTIKQESFIQFEPQGVTATIVGENFHFSIHTWPEHGSCAIDLYSSQEYAFAREIADALKDSFQASEYDIKVLDRSAK